MTCIKIPLSPTADPKTCTDWVQIDVPEDVVFHLRERKRRHFGHFGQAAGSPFTVPPLSSQLGYDAQSDTAEAVLQGEYQYNYGNDPNVLLLLQHLKRTAEIEQLQVDATLSEKEFCGKLSAWRESTSTSPSGLHLGHYKALTSRHRYSNILEDKDDEHRQNRDRLNHMQREMLDLHLTLVNYALARGYYEADYNLAMGVKWRAALYKAETLQLLHNGQFGS